MLQQTQVTVVLPYFKRWMETFPTILDLAQASQEQVLKCWEGLGYYSRARNLHQAAQYITEYFQGILPSDPEKLSQIKGIGPYTQGAIRGFAFRQKASAVDGNVLRVLSRFLAFEEAIDAQKSRMKLQEYAEKILPDHEPWLVSEGLIELGALICAKKAQCGPCPLKIGCLAFRHQLQDVLPKRKERPKTILLKRAVAVIVCNERYLLKQGEGGKVMAGLYEFPYVELDDRWKNDIVSPFENILGLRLNYLKQLPNQQHTFTRYRVQLFPHMMEASHLVSNQLWKNYEELKKLPFSSGHRKILENILSNH